MSSEDPIIKGDAIVSAKGGDANLVSKFDPEYDIDDSDHNLIVVASDGIRFRVNAYCLKTGSTVFGDMLRTGGDIAGPELELSDPEIEKAANVKIFMDFIHHRAQLDIDVLGIIEGINLIRLARKYDCTPVLATLKLQLSRSMELVSAPLPNPWQRFYWCCHLDDAVAAKYFLPHAATSNWIDGAEDDVFNNVKGVSCLDVTGMSAALQDSLPRKYLLALVRAWRRQPEIAQRRNRAAWSPVAEAFLRVLEAQSP